MEFESMSWWLFADDLPAEGIILEFVELQTYKKGQVMVFLGKVKERIGDWKTFPSKISNLKEFLKEYGTSDDLWKGKRFNVKPTDDKKALSIAAI